MFLSRKKSIACVLVTHFPLKVELLRQPDLKEHALLIFDRSNPQKIVLDQSSSTQEVVTGMPLKEALTRCPGAGILEADLSVYREAWGRVLDGLEQRIPVVEDANLGLAYLDLGGLDRLYGGGANLISAVLDSVPRTYRARVGVAWGKFPAYATALHTKAGTARRAPEDIAAFLGPLPVMQLPASWGIKDRLSSFGLSTLGDVAHLSLNAMQGEFGKEGVRLWKLANGDDGERLTRRRHVEMIRHGMTFTPPAVSLQTILAALESLLNTAFCDSRLRGRFVRVVELEARVTDGESWTKRIVFRDPVGDQGRASIALHSNLDNLVLPGPVETLSLTCRDITGEKGRQESLFPDIRRRSQLDHAVRQLRIKLGGGSVLYQIREVEPWSRIPERRRALIPYV